MVSLELLFKPSEAGIFQQMILKNTNDVPLQEALVDPEWYKKIGL